tara:strand:+ start:972 stop:1094 length:123 start_codon:yes stop_codon:yes gene_type:complete
MVDQMAEEEAEVENMEDLFDKKIECGTLFFFLTVHINGAD